MTPSSADLAQLPSMDIAGRADRVRAEVSTLGCDGLLVTNLVNIRYLTGLHRVGGAAAGPARRAAVRHRRPLPGALGRRARRGRRRRPHRDRSEPGGPAGDDLDRGQGHRPAGARGRPRHVGPAAAVRRLLVRSRRAGVDRGADRRAAPDEGRRRGRPHRGGLCDRRCGAGRTFGTACSSARPSRSSPSSSTSRCAGSAPRRRRSRPSSPPGRTAPCRTPCPAPGHRGRRPGDRLRLHCRKTSGIVGPGDYRQYLNLNPGDISFVPQGYLHWIENMGNGQLHFQVVLSHERPETVELSEMLSGVPKDSLSKVFGIPKEVFQNIPEKTVVIGGKGAL